MATKKYVSFDRLVNYDTLIKQEIASGDSASLSSSKDYTDSKVASITNGTVVVKEALHAESANEATNATNAGSAINDGNGNTIVATYETKSDAIAKLDEAKEYTDIKTTNMATTGVVDNKISTHNTSTTAHNDIRTTLAAVKEDVDTFFKDADLSTSAKDTLKELQTYIASDETATSEMLASLANKTDKGHSHVISDVTNLQTTLDGKQATITGGASTIASSNLTASRALISNDSGKVAISAVTSTELGYLDGVTSSIQTQLNEKLNKLTYEWNKQYNAGGTAGYLLIGSFPMYDTNVTIDIDATTNTTYHGTVVIATQNVSETSIGSAHVITVYGDPTGTISDAIRVVWNSGSRNYNVYFVPATWSKNLIHIRAIGNYLDNIDESKICAQFTTGTAPATTSGLTVVNALTSAFNKYTLPAATSSALGGVKIGNNITNSSGTISLTKSNVTTALGYTPPTTDTTYGVVSTTADGLAPKRDGSTTKFLRADGTWAVPPDTNTTYTLSSFGITATAAELNALDGITATVTELNYCDGVTSNIQTQLNAKQATISGGASTIASSNLTASRALVSNSSGKVAVSAVTSTELGYLDGVTSAIQTQLNGKASSSHKHTGETIEPICIELKGMSTSVGHGGYIDFHYNNSSEDYTSRIIESENGVLSIQYKTPSSNADSGVIATYGQTWITPTLKNSFTSVSDNPIKYRKFADTCQITGRVARSTAIGTSALSICDLPEGFGASYTKHFFCPTSGANIARVYIRPTSSGKAELVLEWIYSFSGSQQTGTVSWIDLDITYFANA